MKHFRVLVVCGGSHVSGMEIMNLTLIKQLTEMEHSVSCLVSGWNDGVFIARLQALEIPYTIVKLGNLYITRPGWTLASLLNLPKAIFRIKKLLSHYKPDIVLLNDGRNFLYTSYLWNGFNVIFWEHNLPAISAFNRLTYNKIHRKAQVIVACSEFVKKRLEALISPSRKIITVHNGIDLTGAGPSTVLKEQHADVRIGIVGQLVPRKGHLLLIEAISRLIDKGLNCNLFIYGNDQTEYAATVRAFALERKVSEHIQWMGFVSDKNDIFSHLDIVVVPSTDEPFGLVALEPALWHIPSVVAASGGLPELVVAGSTGLLFQPGNADDLATQLEILIRRPALRLEMGRQAYSRVLQYFSANKMAARFIDIFDQLNITETNKR